MKRDEVYSRLCHRDPRNPLFQDIYGLDETPPVPRVNCSCHQCFRGCDRLAMEALRLMDAVDTAIAALTTALEKAEQ